MAAFFRGLLLFLVGAIVGAGGILFFTPSFNVVVSRSTGVAKPLEVAAAPTTPPTTPPAAVAAVTPKPVAPVATPAAPIVAVAPAPVASPAVPASAEPSLDFKAISEHLILWPTSVTVKTANTVPVLVDGKKVQDLALEVGAVLQVSKVLADGSLEARAKGAKFEIKSSLTDFAAELAKRVAELVAKGAKIDPPFAAADAGVPLPLSAPVAMTSPVAAQEVPAAPAAAPAAMPWPRLTLAQRVDVLFGNTPESAVRAPTSAPAVSPSAPAPAAAPAVEATPAVEPQAAEKGKDLDRKINQLFK